MIHTSITRNCTVFLLRRELSRSAIYGSPNFDSHKWPTVSVDRVNRKPRNFEAYMQIIVLLLQYLSNHTHFTTNRYRTIFKDQLDRSKATSSVKDLTGKYSMACFFRYIICMITISMGHSTKACQYISVLLHVLSIRRGMGNYSNS